MKQKKEIKTYYNSSAMTLGYTVMAAVCFFTFIGYKIDQKFKTQIWTLVGIFAGLVYSGYEVWKLVRNLQKEENKKQKKKTT